MDTKKLAALAAAVRLGSFTRAAEELGYTQSAADTMRGVYGMCLTIFNMPCAFITPITISIIPAITSHLTLCGDEEAKATEESAVRITGLIAMPCAFGLALLAEPITALLGGYSGGNLAMATRLMTVLGFTILFNALVLVSTAIMQAHGHAGRPVINMLIGGVVKIAVNFVLVGIPSINIVGAPAGTLVCYIVITILNIRSLRKSVRGGLPIVRNLIRPLVASALMGAATFMVYRVLAHYLPSVKLACLAALVFAVCVYLVLAVALRCITYEDCMLLPKGEKIAKILRIRQK